MIFNSQLKLVKNKSFSDYIQDNINMPVGVEVSLTGSCNADCPECFYKNAKDNEKIVTDKLLTFLKYCNACNIKAVTYTGGGEPALHPDFDKIIKACKLEQGLFTNALAIPKYDASLLKWIRISKTNMDWPEKSIKKLRGLTSKIGLCVNYKGDETVVERGLKLVHDNDLRYLNIRPALNRGSYLTKIQPPTIKDDKLIVSGYKFNDSGMKRGYIKCYGYKFVPFLWHDGIVNVCAYQRFSKKHQLGNIYEDSFFNIIKNIVNLKGINVDDNCQICCKNHEINKLINDVSKLEDENFI